MKANRKALNRRTFEIFMYGNVLFPNSSQITRANKELKERKRNEQRQINLNRFIIKRQTIEINKQKINYIQKGFDIAKQWRNEYEQQKTIDEGQHLENA